MVNSVYTITKYTVCNIVIYFREFELQDFAKKGWMAEL
jgi:hypothetical protein